MAKFEENVRGGLTRTPTQNEFDAMVIFAFNTGLNMAGSNMIKKFNAGDVQGAAREFDVVTARNASGEQFGLVRRRFGETQIFLHGDYSYDNSRAMGDFPSTLAEMMRSL